ncbi:MAG: enoyl-CoA hydratase-related protein [Archangium sp.]|nr:enoyl-CoA hydratase-related protein [Archangium sp.]MDP3154029.1 enoyl-CoA hydratase-related protein [Archangium sp.]MDP3570068.1 enoyl-CoA hydratase-related protein [Archangium sp.]
MPASLQVVEVAEGVRSLTISHPEKKNALDADFLDALEHVLTKEVGVRAWLLRAQGSVFSSGYDLTALKGFPEGRPLPEVRMGEVFDRLARHPAPSVALVTGPAVGAGCELAAACDFRVGNVSARFSMPPAKLGVVYALKGLQRVASRVGEQAARRMFLTARPVGAEEAARLGLLDVLSDSAEAEAIRLCTEIAALAPLAVQGMKRGFELFREAREQDLAAYETLRRVSFNSDDAREGKEALLARRPPKFTGA